MASQKRDRVIDVDSEFARIVGDFGQVETSLRDGRKLTPSTSSPPIVYPDIIIRHPEDLAGANRSSALVVPDHVASPVIIDGTVEDTSIRVVTPSRWPAVVYHAFRAGVVSALLTGLVVAVYQIVAAISGFAVSHVGELVLGAIAGLGVVIWTRQRLIGCTGTITRTRGVGAYRSGRGVRTLELDTISDHWIDEMEHGNWKQTTRTYGDGNRTHCALGLLYRCANDGRYSNGDFHYGHLINLGYNEDFLVKVEMMNQKGKSFSQIARYARREMTSGRDRA